MYDFITADEHFGHAGIARHCNRPEGWQDFIISEWNRVVLPSNRVLLLGDFALFTDHKVPGDNWLSWEEGEEILSKLNGHKSLVKGNHDQEEAEFYLQLGFEEVFEKYLIDWETAKIPLLFTHRSVEPRKARSLLFGDELSTKRYLNFHGHTHNAVDDPTWIDNRIHYNVGIDRIGYAPMNLSEFIRRNNLNR